MTSSQDCYFFLNFELPDVPMLTTAEERAGNNGEQQYLQRKGLEIMEEKQSVPGNKQPAGLDQGPFVFAPFLFQIG